MGKKVEKTENLIKVSFGRRKPRSPKKPKKLSVKCKIGTATLEEKVSELGWLVKIEVNGYKQRISLHVFDEILYVKHKRYFIAKYLEKRLYKYRGEGYYDKQGVFLGKGFDAAAEKWFINFFSDPSNWFYYMDSINRRLF